MFSILRLFYLGLVLIDTIKSRSAMSSASDFGSSCIRARLFRCVAILNTGEKKKLFFFGVGRERRKVRV